MEDIHIRQMAHASGGFRLGISAAMGRGAVWGTFLLVHNIVQNHCWLSVPLSFSNKRAELTVVMVMTDLQMVG